MSELVLHEKETHLMCSVCKVVCASRKELLMHTHHSCKLCSLEFLSSGALLDHQHREHSKCPHCSLVFRDADTLARHNRLQHCDHIKCTVCGALFSSTLSLMDHLKTHVPCRTCATFFRDTKSLEEHEKRDHGKSNVVLDAKCQVWDDDGLPMKFEGQGEIDLIYSTLCDKAFTSKQKLPVHVKLDNEICWLCGMVFPGKAQLSLHKRTAHKLRSRQKLSQEEAESPKRGLHDDDMIDTYLPDEDVVEEEDYSNGEEEEEDEEERAESKPGGTLQVKLAQSQGVQSTTTSGDDRDWGCSMCSKAFPSKKNLNAHYRRVHMEKSSLTTSTPVHFKCSFCPQTFTCRNDFVEHNRDCSKGKRVPCNICGKTFSTSGNLAQHKRIHTSEKPYKCDTCGKTFAQNGTLYRHKTVHTKETPFACQACGKQFGLKGNLVMHLRNIHKIVYKEPS